MNTDSEVQRLVEVYRQYGASELYRAKWDERNAGNAVILGERLRGLREILQRHGFLAASSCRVLDIGCGSGKLLADFVCWGVRPQNLYGLDLLEDRIQAARARLPDARLLTGNAESLPFDTGFFDLVCLFTVFSSILDHRMAQNVAGEAARVLRPGGAVVWYDFRWNNPRNPNVRGMSRDEITELFPGFVAHLQSITVFPPLARRLGRLTSVLYPVLASLPLFRTHYLGLLIKPPSE